MGAIKQTRLSRLSTGWVTSGQSLPDKNPGDTGPDFSCINGVATGTWTQTGAQVNSSTLSVFGAATFQSTVSARGQVNADAGIQTGGGTVAQIISSVTAALSLGAIPPLESSSVQTVAVSGLSRGDTLILNVDSLYPIVAANRDVTIMCSSSSTVGEAHVWGVNSTLTSVTPTASTFIRLTRIKFGNYPAN